MRGPESLERPGQDAEAGQAGSVSPRAPCVSAGGHPSPSGHQAPQDRRPLARASPNGNLREGTENQRDPPHPASTDKCKDSIRKKHLFLSASSPFPRSQFPFWEHSSCPERKALGSRASLELEPRRWPGREARWPSCPTPRPGQLRGNPLGPESGGGSGCSCRAGFLRFPQTIDQGRCWGGERRDWENPGDRWPG